MPLFESLPEKATVPDIFRMNLDVFRHWIPMTQVVMTGPSALSEGEREMIATYVSVLNGCSYCVASHRPTMAAWGLPSALIDALLDDIETAEVDARLKPVLRFARKLTLAPGDITRADTAAVLDAGWDERALHDAILVVCHFNYMNRLVEAHGLQPLSRHAAEQQAQARVKQGYSMLDKLVQEDRD